MCAALRPPLHTFSPHPLPTCPRPPRPVGMLRWRPVRSARRASQELSRRRPLRYATSALSAECRALGHRPADRAAGALSPTQSAPCAHPVRQGPRRAVTNARHALLGRRRARMAAAHACRALPVPMRLRVAPWSATGATWWLEKATGRSLGRRRVTSAKRTSTCTRSVTAWLVRWRRRARWRGPRSRLSM